MFLTFLICSIIALFIVGLIISVSVGVLLITSSLSIHFSRITVSLALGVGFSNSAQILNNSRSNTILWILIVLAAVYLLSQLPRLALAIKFLCTCSVTYIVVHIIVGLALAIYNSFVKTPVELSLLPDVLIKLGVIGFSYGNMVKQLDGDLGSVHSDNAAFLMVQRVLASLLYGFAALFMVSANVSGYSISLPIEWLVFLGSSVLFFFLDFILLGEAIN